MNKEEFNSVWENLKNENKKAQIFDSNLFKINISISQYDINNYLYSVCFKEFDLSKVMNENIDLENLSVINFNDNNLIIILKNEELLKSFISILYDIHNLIIKSLNHKEAYDLIIDLLSKYLFLFKKKSKNNEEKVLGLFGELTFLFQGLNQKINLIPRWFGSDGNRHDFSINNNSVEIKSSYKRREIITISSEVQLLIDPPEKLYLKHYFFDVKRGDSTDSMKEIINSIILKLDSQQKLSFIKKLHDYSITFNEGYSLPEPFKIELLTENVYEVSSSFPKLTPKNLPNGINKVKYELNSSSIKEFKIENENLWNLII